MQLTFWSQKTSADRKDVFKQGMDDKDYVRPGTRESFSKARNVQVVMFSDDAKQRKLPKYGFEEKWRFCDAINPQKSPQRRSNVGGSEKLASNGNRHFVLQDQRLL